MPVNFEGRANFESTHFNSKIEFDGTTFNQAKFSNVEFNDIAKFRKVIFGDGEKVNFDVPKMENVSFLNTDTSRVKFAEKYLLGWR
ncbi:MAG: pentapeptide repeat-containing protein [Nitrososphaeraceae archaeon]